jgi:hypothetical protein
MAATTAAAGRRKRNVTEPFIVANRIGIVEVA